MEDELLKVLTDTEAMNKMAAWFSGQGFYPTEDLIQDTVLKCLVNKEKLKHNTSVQGWVYQVMRNTFINQFRREGRVQMFSLFNPVDPAYEMPDDDTLDQIISCKRFDMLVKSASGFKYDEIAENYQIPIGSVKSKIFKQRQQVKQEFR